MVPDVGGPVWGWAVVIGTAILGLALVYGVVMWSRRSPNPEVNRRRDEAVERVYRETERDNRELRS
jgi:type VI protein secretion system component VasK